MLASIYRSNSAMKSGQWSPHRRMVIAISGIQPSVANGITGMHVAPITQFQEQPYHGEDQPHEAFGMPQTRSETEILVSVHLPGRRFWSNVTTQVVSPDPLVVPRVRSPDRMK